jgi:hypothetical protein
MDDVIHANQIQVKATHNSYHVEKAGNTVPDWMYTREPLDAQLDAGIRGFELDTHFVEESGQLEVYHVPTLDDQTVCREFTECLRTLKAWSDTHEGHHVLFVQIEPKEPSLNQVVDFAAYADAMDRDLLSVWPRDRLVTPADVQGDAPTLRDAVTTHGWPTLGETRGKALFYVNERTVFHDAYTRGGSDIEGRVLFPQSTPDEPIGGVVILNTPSLDTAAVVERGFLVRTMADSVPIPENAAERRQTALDSGAQIVSTDFPHAVEGVDPGFDFPGEPSRCNPVNAPKKCRTAAVENPTLLVGAP